MPAKGKLQMPRFEIHSDGVLVGYSDLEGGDPPMGVAGGKFMPVRAYDQIRSFTCLSPSQRQIPSQECLKLVVRDSGGREIPSSGGIQITDYSAELGPEGLVVEVLGIGYPLYEELFPEHVAAYRNQ
jgi:hypothetical protein